MTRCTCPPTRSRRAEPVALPPSSAAPEIDVVFPDDASGQRVKAWFDRHTQPAIDAAFAPGELAFPLVVWFGVYERYETRKGSGTFSAGFHKYVANRADPEIPDLPRSHEMVGIPGVSVGLDYIVIHELVHALRHHQGRRDTNLVKEEVWTELEALARAPYGCIRHLDADPRTATRVPGYYDYLGEQARDAMRTDRILLTGGLRQNIGNGRAATRVREAYAQTNLSALDGRASFRRARRPWMVI